MKMHNPPHPGEIIREFCVEVLELTVSNGAKLLRVSRKTFSALLIRKSCISQEMALRLSKVFGRTPEGLLKLQLQYDLWQIEQKVDLSYLKKIKAA